MYLEIWVQDLFLMIALRQGINLLSGLKETLDMDIFLFIYGEKATIKKRSIKRLRPYRIGTLKIDENGVDFYDLKRISKFKWLEPKKKSVIRNNEFG